MSNYTENQQLSTMVGRLVNEHHPDLASAKIAAVMKEGEVGKNITEPAKGKRPRIVKARKVPDLFNFLSGYDLVVEVEQKYWDGLELQTQEAFLDAALCRIGLDPEKGYYLKNPLEIFPEAIARHGLYTNALRELGETLATQLELPLKGADEKLEMRVS